MSTSVTARKRSPLCTLILLDLSAALFCALFGAVYEAFGHGVWSYPMVYAFAFPLVLGVLPLVLLWFLHAPYPRAFVRNVYHAGIAALTVGSIVSGVLEIYGTTHPLTFLYWIFGGALVLIGAIVYLVQRNAQKPFAAKPKPKWEAVSIPRTEPPIESSPRTARPSSKPHVFPSPPIKWTLRLIRRASDCRKRGQIVCGEYG